MFVAKYNAAQPIVGLPPGAIPPRASGNGSAAGQSGNLPRHARSAAIAGVRMACALETRRRKGMGDFLNTVLPGGVALGPNPFAPLSAGAGSSSGGTSSAAAPSQPGGANSYWQNTWLAVTHPTDSARQVADLIASTPGNVFSKSVQLFENATTAQRTSKQYQSDKYALYLKLKSQGASPAQIAAAEAQLDAYVQHNTPGLVGGVDPGTVPYDKDPNAGANSVAWWVWALVGVTAVSLIVAAVK